MRWLTIIGAATALASSAAALEPITIKGNAFFAGNERWYIRGVDYLPGGPSKLVDPLADTSICKRDIEYFKDLGINAIRVYTIDNSLDHDECMKALEEAGIYLILDVNTPTRSINRANPKSTYNEVYLQHVFATIDVMGKYTNTALFFSANEVVDDKTTTPAATYVKAVTRDMKNYIAKHLDRNIPVGYSAADVESNRVQMAHYLNCGDDATARSDFFAFNDYSWCGKSSFQQSGWDKKVETYKDYSIPLFLSEYGCNLVSPRPFTEVASLYSTDMTGVFSGGLVYEYSMEENKYGLVEIDGDEVTTTQDYDNLKEQFSKTDNPSGDGKYNSDGKPSKCPAFKEGTWEASDDLPDFPKAAEDLMKNGAGKPLGNPKTGLPADEDDDDSNKDSSNNSNGSNDSSDSSDSSSSDDSNDDTSAASGLTRWSGLALAAIAAAVAGLA